MTSPPSCPDVFRASMSGARSRKDVDGRDKPGHDAARGPADLVTETGAVKHHFAAGVKVQEGIVF